MAIKTNNKTALESALNYVGNTATGAVNAVKNTFSNVAQGASKSFGDFYSAFNQDYNKFKANTDQQKTQQYNNLTSFVNQAAQAPQ